MKELEDTHCEVRKIVDLQASNWDCSNNRLDDEVRQSLGSPTSNGSPNFLGGFLEDANYAWLCCGPKLTVVNVKTGVNVSSWTFRERVSCVSPFPAQGGQIPLLLVGLDNGAIKIKESSGMICIFNCTTSQVLRAIRMPSGVEQCCVINGGVEWEEMNDNSVDTLMEHQGMACVTLRNLDHFMVDLRRNSWENQMNSTPADEGNPADIDLADSKNRSSRHKSSKERHAVHNLMNKRLEQFIGFNRVEFESSTLCQDKMTSAMTFKKKIGCLLSGCLGRVIIWQNDGKVRWISPALDDDLIVSNLALLEPTDDPRPFCYLWVSYENRNARSPFLRMYAMLFEKKYLDKGANFYFNLEGEPSLKLELELDDKSRVISLYPIVRENNQDQTEMSNKRGDDNLLLVNTEERTILFDLNQWYKEQMPRFLGECTNADAIFANYRTKHQPSLPENILISCAYLPSTLKEFSSTNPTSPEEFFFPNSLAFEWAVLGSSRITSWMSRGVQGQLLRDMAMTGPAIMLQPSETFHRCTAAGLILSNSETSFPNDEDTQRDALLSLCLEQQWTSFLLRCAKEWSDGSAAYLFPSFIRWGIQRASTIKLISHRLCIPLFDQSGSSIGEAEVKTLRFFSQQIECLHNVVDNLPIESGDLEQQKRALQRISTYLQVLLWFYDVGLLPETQDLDDQLLPISFNLKIPYPAERLAVIYAEKREQYRQQTSKKDLNEDTLFIDELISRECPALRAQWEQESIETTFGGHYPPPSLQSLLRSCLTDCYYPDSHEMESKHQIIIYLLMDLVTLLQGSCPGVDQLIKYPSAFKLSPSLIKLTHALWFLDHEDYQGFLDTMTGQLVSEADIKDWHHQLIMRTLLRSRQNKMALIYLRVRKPPLASMDDQGTAISLSVEYGLVQSAFHRRPPTHYRQLLMRFFRACKAHGKLNDILHLNLEPAEEDAFVQFLEEEKCEETRLIYYLQRCRYNEAGNVLPSGLNTTLQKTNKPAALSMFDAYSATLPEISRQFSSSQVRKNLDVNGESRFPHPMSHYKSRVRPRDLYETVIRKARETFVRGDSAQIPFISAPCLSLKTARENVDSNCVLFVERIRRSYGKRTRDQMNQGNITQNNELEPRKRRRVEESSNEVDASTTPAINMSMIFDTPLVKKKHQMANGKETPIETPHSILKIRQMIRDSASPSRKITPTEEKVCDRDKKPRQIRFSINQPKIDNSINPLEDEQSINNECLEERRSTQSRSVTPTRELSATDSNDYHSPSTSTIYIEETAILTDDSSYLSTSLCGPRPRPSLKRSSLESPVSIISTESPTNSINNSDVFLSSQVVSSTFMDPLTPKFIDDQKSSGSSSIYTPTILSPNTDIELSFEESPSKRSTKTSHRTSTSSPVQSTPQLDRSKKDHSADNISIHSFHTPSHVKSRSETNAEEMNVKVSELMEVSDSMNRIPGVESPEKEEFCSLEIEEDRKSQEPPLKMQEYSDLTIQSEEIMDIYQSDEDTDKQCVSSVPFVDETEESSVNDNLKVYQDGMKPSCDSENESIELKYEIEDDEAFQSFSDSMEKHQQQEKSIDQSELQSLQNKIDTQVFNEESNMTDDESSRSMDTHESTTEQMQSLETEIPESVAAPPAYEINITDDDTEDGFDTPKLSFAENSTQIGHESEDSVISNVREDTTKRSFVENKNKPENWKLPQMTRFIRVVSETSEKKNDWIKWSPSQSASTASIPDEYVADLPDLLQKNKTRRAASPVREITPTRVLRPNSKAESPDVSSAKRGRARRSTSLMIEVLTTSSLQDLTQDDAIELSGRVTRRAAFVPKETTKTLQTPPKNMDSSNNSLEIEEIAEEKAEAVKKTRGRREGDVPLRKTRTTSVSSDNGDDVVKKETIKKWARAQSESNASHEVSETIPKLTKRTRTASFVENETKPENLTPSPMTRSRASSIDEEQVPVLYLSRVVSESSERKEDDSTELDILEMSLSRTASTASVPEESVPDLSDFPQENKTRRAVSPVREITPTRVLRSNSRAGSPDVLSAKRGRARRSTSLMKEVLTTSLLHDRTQDDAIELSGRRMTRRAASVQKETTKTLQTPPKNVDSSNNSSEIEEIAEEKAEAVMKTRGRRAGSSKREVDVPPRKTRTTSVSSDNGDDAVKKETNKKRTRAQSESNASHEVSETIPKLTKRTRTASVSKESSEEPNTEKTITTRSRRAASVQKETEAVPLRKTRASSQTKDIPEEIAPRKTRARSVAKEDGSVVKKMTRSGSQSKEIPEEAKTSNKRVTRRMALTSKEHDLDYLKTSILTDVIPEESDEEMVDVKTSKLPQRTTRVTQRTTRAASVDVSQTDVTRRTRGLAKNTTVELSDEEDEPTGKGKAAKKTTTRKKRATSETKEIGSQKTSTSKQSNKLSSKNDGTNDGYIG